MVVAAALPGSGGQFCGGHLARHRHLTEFWQGRWIRGGTDFLAVDFLSDSWLRCSRVPEHAATCRGIIAKRAQGSESTCDLLIWCVGVLGGVGVEEGGLFCFHLLFS